jgi:hypothetical protein
MAASPLIAPSILSADFARLGEEARADFRLDPPAPGEGGAPEASLTAAGALRILPCHREGGTDGFFVARLVRLPGLSGGDTSGA